MSAAPQIRTALTENLKELHLPTMRECFEQAAHQAGKETLSYEQYLLQLTERDVADCIPADLPPAVDNRFPVPCFPNLHDFRRRRSTWMDPPVSVRRR